MASITEYYGISRPVPFVDVDVSRDNQRYLDPHLIRLRTLPTPFAAEAVHCLDTFFDFLSRAAMSANPRTRAAALATLQRFTEPWETRFGMAAEGFSGHGGADDVGIRIWTSMTTELPALLEVGILKHLEHLPMFVRGVDRDITSDITTRIVFGPLADFTAHVLALHPEFTSRSHETKVVSPQVWDPVNRAWTTRSVRLPAPEGQPLLLVPNGWDRHTLLMSHTRYYETSLLTYIQELEAVLLSDGKLVKSSKDLLKKRPDLKRGRETNLEITLRAHNVDQDLIGIFQAFVRRQLDATGENDAA